MKQAKVILTEVGEVQTSEQNGNPYFIARFKQGTFGKTVVRTLWGKEDDDGEIVWDRVSPDELAKLVGRDFSGEVFVEAAEIEPQDFVVHQTGEVVTYTSRSFVRFADETQEQALRRSGSQIKKTGLLPSLEARTNGVLEQQV